MSKKHSINIRVDDELRRQIDRARAAQTEETGKPISRGEVVRQVLRQSLAASYIPAPMIPVTLTKDA